MEKEMGANLKGSVEWLVDRIGFEYSYDSPEMEALEKLIERAERAEAEIAMLRDWKPSVK